MRMNLAGTPRQVAHQIARLPLDVARQAWDEITDMPKRIRRDAIEYRRMLHFNALLATELRVLGVPIWDDEL